MCFLTIIHLAIILSFLFPCLSLSLVRKIHFSQAEIWLIKDIILSLGHQLSPSYPWKRSSWTFFSSYEHFLFRLQSVKSTNYHRDTKPIFPSVDSSTPSWPGGDFRWSLQTPESLSCLSACSLYFPRNAVSPNDSSRTFHKDLIM